MLKLEKVDHIGIRVTQGTRATQFYESLGFSLVARHEEGRVVILAHPSGIEINLIVNGVLPPDEKNILMDAPDKYPGHTHVALRVTDIAEARQEMGRLGITITEGPIRLGNGMSLFIRDPDGTVIELRQALP